MKFYVTSVMFDGYSYAEDILRVYPKITNWSTEEIETKLGLRKMLIVELNTAEDFLRFVKEVDCEIIIEDSMRNGKPSILIYDGYLEKE